MDTKLLFLGETLANLGPFRLTLIGVLAISIFEKNIFFVAFKDYSVWPSSAAFSWQDSIYLIGPRQRAWQRRPRHRCGIL